MPGWERAGSVSWQADCYLQACPGTATQTLPKKHGLLMAVGQVSPVTEIALGTLAMSGDIVVTAGGEDATGI